MLPWIIIALGISLRLIRYLHNTPLWFDEAVIATDLIKRPIFSLTGPSSDYTQTGPLSFYLLNKLAIQVFGNNEYALRFIPFCFGILSLPLYLKVARSISSNNAPILALSLFAVLDPLVFYSTELKPYSGDVFFTLLALAAITGRHALRGAGSATFAAVAGCLAVISSNPSVFFLAGAGVALLIAALVEKDRPRFYRTALVCLAWGICFIAIYMFYISKVTAEMAQNISVDRAMKMENFMMPFPPASLKDIQWYIDFFFDTFLFQDPIIYVKKVTLSELMAFSFLAGIVVIFRRNKHIFSILLLPILFTFIASLIHLYPFKGRQILFLVPLFLIFIAEGADYVVNSLKKTAFPVAVIFLCLLFIYPVSWAAYHVKKPLVRSEITDVLRHIKENWRDGDIIYVHFFAQYEFEYYTRHHPERFSFDSEDYVVGIGPRGWYDVWRKDSLPERYMHLPRMKQSKQDLIEEYMHDLRRLSGHPRAWILFTGDTSSTDIFLNHLDAMGQRIASIGRPGLTTAYLYEFK
jgi:hypothetical protein